MRWGVENQVECSFIFEWQYTRVRKIKGERSRERKEERKIRKKDAEKDICLF